MLCRYGLQTNGNILVNAWLGGRADGVLDAVVAAYLAISIPPMQVPRPHVQHSSSDPSPPCRPFSDITVSPTVEDLL